MLGTGADDLYTFLLFVEDAELPFLVPIAEGANRLCRTRSLRVSFRQFHAQNRRQYPYLSLRKGCDETAGRLEYQFGHPRETEGLLKELVHHRGPDRNSPQCQFATCILLALSAMTVSVIDFRF